MRTLVAPLAALALLCCGLQPVYGCASALPIIHTIATAVATITGGLDQAEAAVDARPDADPALVARVREAIGKARKLLEVVKAANKAANKAAEGASSQDYAAAVAALLDAYDAVLDAARAFGVLAAPAATRGRLGAAAPGVYLVPTRAELQAEFAREQER